MNVHEVVPGGVLLRARQHAVALLWQTLPRVWRAFSSLLVTPKTAPI